MLQLVALLKLIAVAFSIFLLKLGARRFIGHTAPTQDWHESGCNLSGTLRRRLRTKIGLHPAVARARARRRARSCANADYARTCDFSLV